MASLTPPIHAYLKKVGDFLNKDFERSELTIDFIRYIALWGHPLYYVLCTYIFPQPYESFLLRFGLAVTFIPILFYKRCPLSFRPWLMVYWYLWLTFTFPVIFTYLMLMNNFSGLWLVAETVSLLVFIIFIPNFFLFALFFIFGISAAYLGYVQASGHSLSVSVQIIEYFVSIPVAILLGLLVNYTNRKGAVADERNQVLQSLAGSIAHEMRNPLGQIRNCLNAIQNLLPKRQREEIQEPCSGNRLDNLYERVAHGQLAVKRGVQVIDMVLDEIREKPIDPDSFTYLSAVRLTRKAIEEYGYDSELERERVHLYADDAFTFRINETLFVFVIFNLMKNALFYLKSHPQSEVTIRLKNGEQHNYIFFRDTGPGIQKVDLPHIFDGFYTKGKKGGTGLGLSYCKRVMTAFGGNILCDSVKEQFTEFTLAFPVVNNQEVEAYNALVIAQDRPDFRGKRLLIVDDDPLYRRAVRSFLQPLETAIDEAESGIEALEMLRRHRCDLVLMDLSMPSMTGYETVERMRNGEAGADAARVPVVAHSAEPPHIAEIMSEKAGMQAFLSKPCSQAELINILRAALQTIPSEPAMSRMFAGKRVLLADDSALNRDIIAITLRDASLEVAVSGDGKESWKMLQKQRFDLLLTDIRMPGMDGLELVRMIRSSSDPEMRKLPVIGISGAVEEEEGAKAAGMNEFLLKTDSSSILLAAISRLLVSGSGYPSRESPVRHLQEEVGRSSAASYGLSQEESEKLMAMFFEEYRHTPDQLQTALENNDIRGIQAIAHKLKGTAALIGAMSVRQAAEELEGSCRAGRAGVLEQQVKRLTAALEEL